MVERNLVALMWFFSVGDSENCHPFDSKKYQRIYNYLVEAKIIRANQVIRPNVVPAEDLTLVSTHRHIRCFSVIIYCCIILQVHSQKYLNALRTSSKVAAVTEFPPIALFPRWLVDLKVLTPMQYHVSGTILAGYVATERGWCINLGGGMHHAHADDGGGWCVYADVALSIRYLRRSNPGIKKVMYIDLDVHVRWLVCVLL